MAKAPKKARELQGPPIPEQPNYRFGLGWVLKHISGVEGYVYYRVDNLTGCNQYGIQCVTTDNSKPETHMFDEVTLEDTGRRIEMPKWVVDTDATVETPGGISQPIRQIKIK